MGAEMPLRRARGALLLLSLPLLLLTGAPAPAEAGSAEWNLFYNSATWNSAQRRCGKAGGGRLATVGTADALANVTAGLAAKNWTSGAGGNNCSAGVWLGYFNPKGRNAVSCGTPNTAAFRPVDGSGPPLRKMCVLGDSCGSCLALYTCGDRGLCLRRLDCATKLPYLCTREDGANKAIAKHVGKLKPMHKRKRQDVAAGKEQPGAAAGQ